MSPRLPCRACFRTGLNQEKSWDRRDTFRESVIQSSAGKTLASWLLFSAIEWVFMVVAQKNKA